MEKLSSKGRSWISFSGLGAMLDRVGADLCFDQSRFSYGGMMSFAIGSGRADVFRAIAPMSGALFSGCEDGDASIAMLDGGHMPAPQSAPRGWDFFSRF